MQNTYEKTFGRYIQALKNLDAAREAKKTGWALNTYKRAVRHWNDKLQQMDAAIEAKAVAK